MLWFTAISAFQLCHVNILIFIAIMMIYTSLTLTYFPYSDSPGIEVPFHSDNLLQPNNSLLLILYVAW